MGEKIDRFCETLRQKLTALEVQLGQVKTKVEAVPDDTQAALRAKLDEAKAKVEAKKQEVEAFKVTLEEWATAKQTETEESIQAWVDQKEIEKLNTRADRAEDYAAAAMMFAVAAMEEADLATLEAIDARMAADTAAAD
jgi:vacuolar-type H+-ATPase subunit I/STV1